MKLGKQHLALSFAGLVLAGAYNIWSQSGATAPVRPVAAGPAPVDALPPTAAPAASGAVDPTQIPAVPDVVLDRLPEWPRNPFANLRQRAPDVVEAAAEPAPAEAEVVVGSILYSSGRRLATVNGRIVRVGDLVGSGTVVDILPNAVVIDSPLEGRRVIELRRRGAQRAPR